MLTTMVSLTLKGKNKMNQPLDKGRVAVIVEKYPTNQMDQNGQPMVKNRYANVGRATLWPSQQYSTTPNVEIELDALPIGHTGKLKLYVFWNSDNKNNQPQPTAAPAHQSVRQQAAPQHNQQRTSWGNQPQQR